MNGKTLMSIPGYKDKVPFGVMTDFAYPVQGSGEAPYIYVSYNKSR